MSSKISKLADHFSNKLVVLAASETHMLLNSIYKAVKSVYDDVAKTPESSAKAKQVSLDLWRDIAGVLKRAWHYGMDSKVAWDFIARAKSAMQTIQNENPYIAMDQLQALKTAISDFELNPNHPEGTKILPANKAPSAPASTKPVSAPVAPMGFAGVSGPVEIPEKIKFILSDLRGVTNPSAQNLIANIRKTFSQGQAPGQPGYSRAMQLKSPEGMDWLRKTVSAIVAANRDDKAVTTLVPTE